MDLASAACESINVDLSQQEIADADGYRYVVLVAYDIDSITGVEFALDGWPTGRGAPRISEPYWCEAALTLGDHEDGGGITAFEACVQPDSNRVASLAYWSFGPLDSTDLPIDLAILASTYSDADSALLVLDCSVDYVQDDLVATSGCALGGVYSGTAPECEEQLDGGGDQGGSGGDFAGGDEDGNDEGGGESGQGLDSGGDPWAHVKFCGPSVQYLTGLDTLSFYRDAKRRDCPAARSAGLSQPKHLGAGRRCVRLDAAEVDTGGGSGPVVRPAVPEEFVSPRTEDSVE